MTEKTTRSSETYVEPSGDELDRLQISPEVHWFLWSRGIPVPDCPPMWKTPEPRSVPGAKFDPERVDRVLTAFGHLRHTQGEWAGKPLRPDLWEVAYLLAPVFGWVKRNSRSQWVRIIRSAYMDVPRKNGKTTLAGGIATYLTAADGEQGAQVLAAAASRQQAGYCFEPVKQIALRSPALKPHIKPLAGKLIHERSGSYFMAVSAIAELLHGANVHGAVVDELHVHKSGDLLEAIETGTGSRSQPLIVIITTADASKPGTVYDQRRKLIEDLAKGTLSDPSMYGVVFAADEDDDPFAEETWRKANPGYGVSPTREFMESAATKAKNSPAELAAFLRLHLGIRTKQETKLIRLEDWDNNASIVTEDQLVGRTCYGGLDLASVSDLTALCLLFPSGDGTFDVIWRHWLPEDAVRDLSKRTAGEADVWVREGLILTTPGNVVDYDFIRSQIHADAERFDVVEIAYDPWNSSQIVTDLVGDGMEMVPMRQGFASMSPPLKELHRLILTGTPDVPVFRHGGSPLVRWQIDNLAVAMDAAGNVKPDKSRAVEKIDGAVAAVMALDRAMRHGPGVRSAYEDGDLMVV